MLPITYDKLTVSYVVSLNREYGTIDDVDIDLHINIGFLDVSQHSSSLPTPPTSLPITILTLTFCKVTHHL